MFVKTSVLLVLIFAVCAQCSQLPEKVPENQLSAKEPSIQHEEKRQPTKRQAVNQELTASELADALTLLLGKPDDGKDETQSNSNLVDLYTILQGQEGPQNAQDKPLPKPSVPLPLKDVITSLWDRLKNHNPKPNSTDDSFVRHVVEIGKGSEILGSEEYDDGSTVQEVRYLVDSRGKKHIIRKTVRPTANLGVTPNEIIDIVVLRNGHPQRVVITKDPITGKYNIK